MYSDCVSQLAVAEQNYNFWVSDKASPIVIFLNLHYWSLSISLGENVTLAV